MKHLVFAGGSGVRAAAFERRSLVAVSAACLVANAIREQLALLCGAEVDLRLWPPAIPQPAAWEAILCGARSYAVRGERCDGAIVLRPRDARALAAMLFGERTAGADARALSPMESEITRRAVVAIVPSLSPVCGETHLDESGHERPIAYFELHVVAPLACAIGIALSREPRGTVTNALRPQAFEGAPVEMTFEMPLGALCAREIARLRAGDVLAQEAPALLRVNGEPYARGEAGVSAERYAARLCAFR
ncbi:MAG: FliM/FliN family flagellar motor C-terminal domain-containing protein [Candidatus Tyrphobacter sp.]